MEEDSKTETAAPATVELIQSLEQATMMAKQLPITTDQTQLLQIFSCLHQTHDRLSSFLSNTHLNFQPPRILQPHQENSLSSATGTPAMDDGANSDDGEPMQVGDDVDDEEGEEENVSKTSVDMVEERLRDCFIKNKRLKRRLSPSAVTVAEEKRVADKGLGGVVVGLDSLGSKLRALDLVYQFHG